MSVLALLTGRLAPGVWHLDPDADEADPTTIARLADGLGWDVRPFIVAPDKADLIDAVGEAARVPSYVRSNWDSLEDGLRDIAPPRNDRLLLIADAPTVTAVGDVLIEILDGIARFWHGHGVRVCVVWIGPGPGPRLDAVSPIRASRRG